MRRKDHDLVLNLVLIWLRKKEKYAVKVYYFVSELGINLVLGKEEVFEHYALFCINLSIKRGVELGKENGALLGEENSVDIGSLLGEEKGLLVCSKLGVVKEGGLMNVERGLLLDVEGGVLSVKTQSYFEPKQGIAKR